MTDLERLDAEIAQAEQDARCWQSLMGWADLMIERQLMTEREAWIEERAAIMEFDGGLSREDAERRAAELWDARRPAQERDSE